MSQITLSPEEQTERARLRLQNDAFEKWRGRRTCYREAEVPDLLKFTNADRSRLEVLDFMAEPPERYFAYCKTEKRSVARPSPRILYLTTFTGDKLASIVWEGDDFKDNFGGTRCHFCALGVNGVKYSGTYYKSAGDYCRLRRVKGIK